MLFPVVATIIEITTDDDYYLAIRSEPPTFAHYRQVRIEKSNDEWRKRTLEAAYDSYLKKKLREPPEKRYLREKGNWLFHDSSYPMRGLERYDGEGCNGFTGCISECRYYPDKGRIEDAEVIQEHKELEAEDKKTE